jgi:uncharacterized protein
MTSSGRIPRWLTQSLWLVWLCVAPNTHAREPAQLAIIIDDIGYNQQQSLRAARLNGRFTLSILPFTPHGKEAADVALQLGKELMLHAPMSNIQNKPLGKGGLYSGMEKSHFVTTLREDIGNIQHIRGINNHMGSQLTQESEPMQWLMDELKPTGLYFVDSRTTAKTKAFDIAQANQIPSLKRDVFLDDDESLAAIGAQLKRAIQLAQQKGRAIAIGHPYPNTLTTLENLQPLLAESQVSLVFASQLLSPRPTLPPQNTEQPKIKETEPPFCPVPPSFLEPVNVDLYDIGDMMRAR